MKTKMISAVCAMVLPLVAGVAIAQSGDWQAGAGPEWQKVLAAAKKEGRMAVAGPPQLATPITQAFLKDTGIQIEYLGGEARTTASRVTREVRAGAVTIDAMFTGSVELPLVKEGFFEDEASRLMLPGVTNLKNWAGGELKWVDNTKRFMLQTHANVSAVPFYNSNLVKPGELNVWKDLLNPKFKGKIVIYDPRSGGPGQQSATYIGAQLGIPFLKTLYGEQGAVYSLDSRQMAEWVTRGVHMVAIGMLAADYMTFRNAGIKHLVPTSFQDGPGALSGGFSVILLPKSAPRPNAQTVFLNWYASQIGQETYTKALSVPSRRLDVKVDGLPEFIIPKPGVKYQDQYNEDWFMTRRLAIAKEVAEALGGK